MVSLNGTDLRNVCKVYLPTGKQTKTRVRGLWHGASGLCYDYISQTRVRAEDLPNLKKAHSQECLFYTKHRRAYIWYNPNKVEELKRQEYFFYNRQTKGLKDFLKTLLKTYGGFTIYIRELNYLVEVWL